MKIWHLSKVILYLTLAVLIFVFNNAIMSYVGFLVGGIVLLYAAEELIVFAVKKELFNNPYHLFDGIAQILIGAILFIVSDDIVKVCIVWGVWSILRESKELAEAIDKLPKYRSEIINIIESVVVIVLSFFMIVHPDDQHARLHVFLLAAELIIVVMFYFMEVLRDKIISKRKKLKGEDYDESEEKISI